VGAFNVIIFEHHDTAGRMRTLRAQFKYGDTWQYEYRIGDELRWGGNDIGRMGHQRVAVDAILENDDGPPGLEEDLIVTIDNNILVSVEPNTGAFQFVGNDSFVVLD